MRKWRISGVKAQVTGNHGKVQESRAPKFSEGSISNMKMISLASEDVKTRNFEIDGEFWSKSIANRARISSRECKEGHKPC